MGSGGPVNVFHGANALLHALERRRELRVVAPQDVQHRVLLEVVDAELACRSPAGSRR